MASITLENLNKTYPNGFVSVKNLSLHIEDGEFVTFFGPSGCGKSTILRMIGGMEDITSGEIYLGKDLLNDILPRDRSLAMAFQNYQLYSHLNVYDNIALGLRLRNLPRQIIDSRVKMAAHFFNITDILEKKIRVIGYLSSALGSHIMQIRHKAFFHALKQNGLKSDPTYAGSSYYITQCMEKHLPRLLDLGITSIVCNHDLIANAAMIQCQQLGYKVPDEISIIGFDDLPICAYTSPPLTTIRQERIQLGKSAYYALDSLMNQVSIGTLLLHAKLIERGSTGEVLSDK